MSEMAFPVLTENCTHSRTENIPISGTCNRQTIITTEFLHQLTLTYSYDGAD